MNNEIRESIINSRVGAKQLLRWGINAIGRAVSEGEVVLGVMPCDNDGVLCATDSRAFVVSRDGVEFESPYGSITEIDVSTGWFLRGITITTGSEVYSCSTGDETAVRDMGRILQTALGNSNQGVLGTVMPSPTISELIRDALRADESVLGLMVSLNGNALVATDQRIAVVSEEGQECEFSYSEVTEIDVSTGWLTRGITIVAEDESIFVGGDDREAVEAMSDIIREMSPRLGVPETEEREGGGLTGLAKGVFNTATGGDIRKYEEFVDAATTVLVGLHQDQAALSAKLGEFDEAIAELRKSNDISRERLTTLESGMAELQKAQSETLANLETVQNKLDALASEIREAQSLIRDIRASEKARSSPSATVVKLALVASGVAVAISVVSILLGFM